MQEKGLIQVTAVQESFLAVTAKMGMPGPLFTSVASLSQSSILREYWLQTHNNDKQPKSKSGNSSPHFSQ